MPSLLAFLCPDACMLPCKVDVAGSAFLIVATPRAALLSPPKKSEGPKLPC